MEILDGGIFYAWWCYNFGVMLKKVGRVLVDEASLDKTSLLVVGVSGGPDSLSLLHGLHALGYPVVVAHLDHGLRPDSAADATFVAQVAADLGVDCVVAQADIATHAAEADLSIEEAARERRYHFLFSVAEQRGAAAVLVAHHADDQVETVLMHLLRGTGLTGLKGMAVKSLNPEWHVSIPLVRPLLTTGRVEILAYCEQQGLSPRFDRSNLDTTFYRNRLRHELIPKLETYNPQVRALVVRMAETLAGDDAIIEQRIAEVWATCILEHGTGYLAVAQAVFMAQLPGVQRRILRRVVAHLRPSLRDIDFAAIERGRAFFAQPTSSGTADWIAGLWLTVEGQQVWVAVADAVLPTMEWPQFAGPEVGLTVGDMVDLSNDWVLRLESFPANQETRAQALSNQDQHQAWLDADALGEDLRLRAWTTGDRFQPLGMGGSLVKLSDFFINLKVPRRLRAQWPLLWAGEQIAWVVGQRLAEPFRVTAQTQTILKLSIEQKGK